MIVKMSYLIKKKNAANILTIKQKLSAPIKMARKLLLLVFSFLGNHTPIVEANSSFTKPTLISRLRFGL